MGEAVKWDPQGKVEDLADKTYYLVSNDEKHRRVYARKGEETKSA